MPKITKSHAKVSGIAYTNKTSGTFFRVL